MKGYTISFKVFAESEQEALETSKVLQQFVNEHGAEGRAVTAKKITSAVTNWKNNIFVKNKIIKYFEL